MVVMPNLKEIHRPKFRCMLPLSCAIITHVNLLDGYGEIESKPFHTTYGDDDLYHTHAFYV